MLFSCLRKQCENNRFEFDNIFCHFLQSCKTAKTSILEMKGLWLLSIILLKSTLLPSQMIKVTTFLVINLLLTYYLYYKKCVASEQTFLYTLCISKMASKNTLEKFWLIVRKHVHLQPILRKSI